MLVPSCLRLDAPSSVAMNAPVRCLARSRRGKARRIGPVAGREETSRSCPK